MFSTEALREISQGVMHRSWLKEICVFRRLVWIQMLAGLSGYAIRLPSLFSDSLLEVTVMGYQMKCTTTLKNKKIWMVLDTVRNTWEEINNSVRYVTNV